jgi:hypothetical protein
MIPDKKILLILIIIVYILFFIIFFAVSTLTKFEPDIETAAKYSAIGACVGPVLVLINMIGKKY